VVIFHRHYGILIIELKSVGRWHRVIEHSLAPDHVLVKRIRTAVDQLNKSEVVVRHLVSDIAQGLSVRKALFLPYISKEQLLRVLEANEELQKVLHVFN
jgi:hypothetical protein